jgi:heptosyltransferase I
LKILILKPSSLGDVVQAIPVLRLLKCHKPEARIYWWLADSLAPLLERDPDLEGIFLFTRSFWSRPTRWPELFRSVRRMRSQSFDWVIDLQGLARSGLFSWLARGEFTVGLDDPREGAAGFYDLAVPRGGVHVHAVDWYLRILETLQVPVHWDFDWLPCQKSVAQRVRRMWESSPANRAGLHNAPTPFITLVPGARWENKRWPAPFFAGVVRSLTTEAPHLSFVILGGTEDHNLAKVIVEAAPERCLDLTGKTTLPEMVEWIRISSLMLANDTGPMHVAAALNKPVLALFGPTEPRRTGPYRQEENVLRVSLPCVPCMKSVCHNQIKLECLANLSPQMVCSRIKDRMIKVFPP